MAVRNNTERAPLNTLLCFSPTFCKSMVYHSQDIGIDTTHCSYLALPIFTYTDSHVYMKFYTHVVYV